MKILTELKNIDLIDDYLNVDGLIVNTKFSISPNPCYIDELEDVIAWTEANNKEIYLRMDAIINEYELEELIAILEKYNEINIIYSDFAIYTYFKRRNRLSQIYYFAQTYCCNYEDVAFYTSKGVHVLISNELNIQEINKICEHNTMNVGLLAYGYFPIFYTKREIGSLYQDYVKETYQENLKFQKNHCYELKEELREERYLFVEKENSACIYSSGKMFVYQEFDLNQFEFLFLSNAFISDEENKQMINFYKDVKEHQDIDATRIELLSKNSFKSFLNKTNEILQEKNKNE